MRTSVSVNYDYQRAIGLRSAALLLFALVPTSAAPAEQVPSSKTSLSIMAICGRGCKDSSRSCRAYVLSQGEYDDRQADRNKKLTPRGTTPLVLEDISPGTYFVAVECTIDTSVVPMEARGYPPITRPAYDKFFADDLPLIQEEVLFTSPDTVEINGEKMRELLTAQRKWYKVTVEMRRRTPVVAIFLEKQSDATAWEHFYPQGQAFSFSLPEQERDMLWNVLDDPGATNPTVDPKQRKTLITLLRRGGRVCLPSPQRGVIWVNNRDLLEASRVIPQNEIYQGQPLTATLSPAKPTSRPANVGTETSAGDALPRFAQNLSTGTNEVRVRNPNDTAVWVGLRCRGSGTNFLVPDKDIRSASVPDGEYEIYFVHANEPGALFQGDDFLLSHNGVEIQLVRVAGGNYTVRRVR